MGLIKKVKAWHVAFLGIVIPALVRAQLTPPINNFGLPGSQNSGFGYEAGRILQIVLGVVGLVAVVFLIIGGFRYITSAGNEETAESAKKTIQNSIIGLVIIILSYIIVTVIINALVRGTAN